MRSVLIFALCLVGCATASPTSPKSVGTSAPGIESKPLGTLCVVKGDCPDNLHCVKPADNAQGVCSQFETGPKCTLAEDCVDGAYCHKPVGFDGVCFKP